MSIKWVGWSFKEGKRDMQKKNSFHPHLNSSPKEESLLLALNQYISLFYYEGVELDQLASMSYDFIDNSLRILEYISNTKPIA